MPGWVNGQMAVRLGQTAVLTGPVKYLGGDAGSSLRCGLWWRLAGRGGDLLVVGRRLLFLI